MKSEDMNHRLQVLKADNKLKSKSKATKSTNHVYRSNWLYDDSKDTQVKRPTLKLYWASDYKAS